MTEILWDSFYVPHIFASDAPSLFHAFALAQMKYHSTSILRLYAEARGRAAEYWGEECQGSDRWVHSMLIPERSQDWYAAQADDFASCLDAFAAGVNDYAHSHIDLLEDAAREVLPVTPIDVLAHAQRVLNFGLVVDPIVAPRYQGKAPASNAWAVAPSRSCSGNAMLLANPHLPWSPPFRWFEAHLIGPTLDAYGVALIGFPTLAIAFNDNLSWTHTVSASNGVTVYELELIEGGYLFDGKVRPFSMRERRIRVKLEDGTLRDNHFTVRHSVHGPVLGVRADKALALRVTGLDQPRALEQWWRMALASNLEEFEAALAQHQIPALSVLYADRDGHIMHVFGGQIPHHRSGTAEEWARIVSGAGSDTLWTSTHPYEDLPRVLDPPSGWLQNANDPPWTTTIPSVLVAESFPAHMAPEGPMSLRAQRSARMVSENKPISFADMIACKFSTEVELAHRVLDELIQAASNSESPTARQAARVLSTWDRRVDSASCGAVLFRRWVEEVSLSTLFAAPWDKRDPLATPCRLADPTGAAEALERAAHWVEAAHGALDVPWGDVFRICCGDLCLPASGGDELLGVFQELWFAPTANHTFVAVGGDSYTAVVEFADPVRAEVLTLYCNSTEPASRQNWEQLQLFAKRRLRPAWRTRREILAHLVARERCTYSPSLATFLRRQR